MAVPILMHSQLWKLTVRWSQLIARPGGRNATKGRPPPESCYDRHGPDRGLPLPSLPKSFWRQPWGHLDHENDECLKGLFSEPDESLSDGGNPYGLSPFTPFTADREHLQPFDSSVFWSRWSESALIPHITYFDSAAHLIVILRETSLDEFRQISKAER